MTDPRRGGEPAPPASGLGGPVATVPDAAEPEPTGPVQVLVVTADPDVAGAVRRAFPDQGCEVRVLAGLAEVVTHVVGAGRLAVDSAQIDVALIDLDLPRLAAVEVARLLAASTGAAVLVTTRSPEPGPVLEALDAGAHDFLAQPVDPDELRLRATAALRARAPGGALPGASRPPGRAVSPSELLHELNNVLGAMRFTVFLSRPRPGGAGTDAAEHTPLAPGEAADRMDGLISRAGALVVELARHVAASR